MSKAVMALRGIARVRASSIKAKRTANIVANEPLPTAHLPDRLFRARVARAHPPPNHPFRPVCARIGSASHAVGTIRHGPRRYRRDLLQLAPRMQQLGAVGSAGLGGRGVQQDGVRLDM